MFNFHNSAAQCGLYSIQGVCKSVCCVTYLQVLGVEESIKAQTFWDVFAEASSALILLI